MKALVFIITRNSQRRENAFEKWAVLKEIIGEKENVRSDECLWNEKKPQKLTENE